MPRARRWATALLVAALSVVCCCRLALAQDVDSYGQRRLAVTTDGNLFFSLGISTIDLVSLANDSTVLVPLAVSQSYPINVYQPLYPDDYYSSATISDGTYAFGVVAGANVFAGVFQDPNFDPSGNNVNLIFAYRCSNTTEAPDLGCDGKYWLVIDIGYSSQFGVVAIHPTDLFMVYADEQTLVLIRPGTNNTDWTQPASFQVFNMSTVVSTAVALSSSTSTNDVDLFFPYDIQLTGPASAPYLLVAGWGRPQKSPVPVPILVRCTVLFGPWFVNCTSSLTMPTTLAAITNSSSTAFGSNSVIVQNMQNWSSKHRLSMDSLTILNMSIAAVGFPALGVVQVVDFSHPQSVKPVGWIYPQQALSVTETAGFGNSVSLYQSSDSSPSELSLMIVDRRDATTTVASNYELLSFSFSYGSSSQSSSSSSSVSPFSLQSQQAVWFQPNAEQPFLSAVPSFAQVIGRSNVAFLMSTDSYNFMPIAGTAPGRLWIWSSILQNELISPTWSTNNQAVSLSKATETCDYGTFSAAVYNFGPCPLCPAGTYSNEYGTIKCFSCDALQSNASGPSAVGYVCPLGAVEPLDASLLSLVDLSYSFSLQNAQSSFDNALILSVFSISPQCVESSFFFWAILMWGCAFVTTLCILYYYRRMRRKMARGLVESDVVRARIAAAAPVLCLPAKVAVSDQQQQRMVGGMLSSPAGTRAGSAEGREMQQEQITPSPASPFASSDMETSVAPLVKNPLNQFWSADASSRNFPASQGSASALPAAGFRPSASQLFAQVLASASRSSAVGAVGAAAGGSGSGGGYAQPQAGHLTTVTYFQPSGGQAPSGSSRNSNTMQTGLQMGTAAYGLDDEDPIPASAISARTAAVAGHDGSDSGNSVEKYMDDDGDDAGSDASVYNAPTTSPFDRFIIKLRRFFKDIDLICEGETVIGGSMSISFVYFCLWSFVFGGLFLQQYPFSSPSSGMTLSCNYWQNSQLTQSMLPTALPFPDPVAVLYSDIVVQPAAVTFLLLAADVLDCSGVTVSTVKSSSQTTLVPFTCSFDNSSSTLAVTIPDVKDLTQNFQVQVSEMTYVAGIVIQVSGPAMPLRTLNSGSGPASQSYTIQAQPMKFSLPYYPSTTSATEDLLFGRTVVLTADLVMVARSTDSLDVNGVTGVTGIVVPEPDQTKNSLELYISQQDYLMDESKSFKVSLQLSRSKYWVMNAETPLSRAAGVALSVMIFTTTIYDLYGICFLVGRMIGRHF